MDHVGYAKEIEKEIKFKRVLINNNSLNKYEKDIIKNKKVIKNNYRGNDITITNLNSRVLTSENDSSLVLYVSSGGFKMLFMGDAPKEVEQDILKKYTLEVDYLKLGHHGSKTSSDYNFLKQLKPKYSIISAGRNNRYNHPSKETLETLKELNLKYFSTITKGSIKMKLKNRQEIIKFYEP